MLTKKEIPYIEHNIAYFLIDYKWRDILRNINFFDECIYKKLVLIPEKNGRSILILYAYLVHIPVGTIALNFNLSQTRIREIIKSSVAAINKCLKKQIDIDLAFLGKEKRLLDNTEILISKKITLHFKAKTELLAVVIKLLESPYIETEHKAANMFYQLNMISQKNLLPNNILPTTQENLLAKKLYLETETYNQFIININGSIEFKKRQS